MKNNKGFTENKAYEKEGKTKCEKEIVKKKFESKGKLIIIRRRRKGK